MKAKPREKMSLEQRAKQFAPFAAITPLAAALRQEEETKIEKIIPSEELLEELDWKIKSLSCGQLLTVTYYKDGAYHKKTGILADVQYKKRFLQVVRDIIPFDDVIDLVQ